MVRVPNAASRLELCLLGTAVGDALGLPCEGLSRRRIERKLGSKPISYRFLFGRGMVSDDTEHAALVAQALLISNDDPERFQAALAWGLRAWLLGLPAGIGLATLRACGRLWIGVSPRKSGVWSAGNGPAMRAAIIGVYFAEDLERLIEFCDRSSEITHRDRRAIEGARVVAIAAKCGTQSADSFFDEARKSVEEKSWIEMIDQMERSFLSHASLEEFSSSLGIQDRVSG